jgi:CheY-like chemotaxis protein
MESLLCPPPRVLVAEPSLPYRRVIREALESFHHCRVDEAPNAERAFELALQHTYPLFIIALTQPDFCGRLLDRLITHAFPRVHPDRLTSPPVIFIASPEEAPSLLGAKRDARLRGVITAPPKLDALLALTRGLLPPAPRHPPLP